MGHGLNLEDDCEIKETILCIKLEDDVFSLGEGVWEIRRQKLDPAMKVNLRVEFQLEFRVLRRLERREMRKDVLSEVGGYLLRVLLLRPRYREGVAHSLGFHLI